MKEYCIGDKIKIAVNSGIMSESVVDAVVTNIKDDEVYIELSDGRKTSVDYFMLSCMEVYTEANYRGGRIMSYSVYSEFDIQKHKETFTNYLEVIMHESGKIEYAVPSHQEKLIAIACKKKKCTREQLNAMCPMEYYFDFITWLCMITGCIAIWDSKFEGKVNRLQRNRLKILKLNGLYKGDIPKEDRRKVDK